MDQLPPKDRKCHRTAFEKSCRELVCSGSCDRWMNVQGRHPQDGVVINQYKCIDDWMPLLLIENSKLLNEVGAAIESFRNETVKLSRVTHTKQIENDNHTYKTLPLGHS